MPAIEFGPVRTESELLDIIRLQQQNLAVKLSPEEIQSQGYVTVSHDMDTLRKMHHLEPSIVARDGNHIVAYALAMTPASKDDIPILEPMFRVFEKIRHKEKLLSDYHYIIVGQVCVDKAYRGTGVFRDLYQAYRHHFEDKYAFAITEIALNNPRSIQAHKNIGFESLHNYTAPDGVRWNIVIWDFN